MTARYVGYDSFNSAPGVHESMDCNVCGSKMVVERNQYGPTSSVAAMAGFQSHHDSFSCPNSGKTWHNQAIALMKEVKRTSSKRLKEMLQEELDMILCTRTPTIQEFRMPIV